jgi:hypothetical protein
MEDRSHFRKGYISREIRGGTDPEYEFCASPHEALDWPSRQIAELIVDYLNRGVMIDSSLGGKYLCREFHIEEIAPEQFAICCEAPFIFDTVQ